MFILYYYYLIINRQFFSKYNNFIFAHVKRMIFHVKKTRIFFLFFFFGRKVQSLIYIIQVHLRKLVKKLIFSCNLFQKVKLSYILDSLHVK